MEEMGGEIEHQLTADQKPAHKHTGGIGARSAGSFFKYGYETISGYGHQFAGAGSANPRNYGYTSTEGNGTPQNNLQPYITVKMWKRTN